MDCIPHHLIFDFLEIQDTLALREMNKSMVVSVAQYPWLSMNIPVFQIWKWRLCYPHAKAVWYQGERPLLYVPRRVTHLRMDHSRVRDCFFRARLTSIRLYKCNGISPRGLALGKTLMTADFSYSKIPSWALCYLTALKRLKVAGCNVSGSDFLRLVNLTSLDVSETAIQTLPALPKLKYLCADSCDNIRELDNLSNGALTHLSICNVYVRSLPTGLHEIVMSGSDGDDGVLDALRGVKKMDLSFTRFDRLSPFQNTRSIKLCGAYLSGLRDLHGDLDFLDISGCAAVDPAIFGNLMVIKELVARDCDWIDNWSLRWVKEVHVLTVTCPLLSLMSRFRDLCLRLKVKVLITCKCLQLVLAGPYEMRLCACNCSHA